MVGAFAQNKSTQSKSSSDSISYLINDLHYPSFILFDGNDIDFYKSPDDIVPTNTLDQYEDCYIVGDNKTKYVCTSHGKAFWVNKRDILLSQDSIDNLLHNNCQAYSECIKRRGEILSLKDACDFYQREVNLQKRCPIIIYKADPYKEDEDLDVISFRFEIINNFRRAIKYIYVTIRGYNAVNDPVGNSSTETCIGPIDSGESATYEFKDIWWTDIIHKVKIIGLKIKFMNNTYRIIPHPEKCRYPLDLQYDTDFMDKLDSCISVSKLPEFEIKP
jgi:hypothetical protein